MLNLPYGNRTLSVSLPAEWLGEVVMPAPVAAPSHFDDLLTEALTRPIGAPPLPELVNPNQRVAIIIDDYTRKTPTRPILTALLRQLHQTGLPPQNITLVFALGSHRPLTPVEVTAKTGPEIAARYTIVNQSDPQTMTTLNTGMHHIPAQVHRAVAKADVRLGIGMITPHLDAGFSGGAKIILPGVCSETTVDTFHAASAFVRQNQLGRLDAPLRRTLENFVAEQIPLHFIVNVVIDTAGQVQHVVAGHFIDAHRAGAEQARRVFGVSAARKYPVVVANCYPYDQDLWQSIKGVWAGELLTETNGTLIMLTAADEGRSVYGLLPEYIGRNPAELARQLQVGQTRDPKQAATGVMFGHLKERVRLMMVSAGLNQADAQAMGIPFYPTIKAAVESAVSRLPAHRQKNSVAILPQAGLTLPITK
jgi:nickel-dependent lactate racemase